MSNPQTRGWGPGWPNCQGGVMVPVTFITGRMHRDIAELTSLLCAETIRRGYGIRKDWSWGYACRPIGSGSTPSYHSWGLAIDINAPTNPMRRPLTTDMPVWMRNLWISYGWTWGGTWSLPDAMHYEWRGTPAQARTATERARRELRGGSTPATPSTGDIIVFPRRGDTGEAVEFWQRVLTRAGFDAGSPDGVYGSGTQEAVAASRSAYGAANPDVERITPWNGMRLLSAIGTRVESPAQGQVDAWLEAFSRDSQARGVQPGTLAHIRGWYNDAREWAEDNWTVGGAFNSLLAFRNLFRR